MSRFFSKLEEDLSESPGLQIGSEIYKKSNSGDLTDLFEQELVWRSEDGGCEEGHSPFEISDLDLLFNGPHQFISGGLPSGKAHEWINENFSAPPLTIPTILVCNALRKTIQSSGNQTNFQRYIVWIGQECWPSYFLLEKTFIASFGHGILSQCLFLKTKDQKETLACIDNALKSQAVFCVFANLQKIPLAASRRFSLLLKKRPALAFFFLPKNQSDKPTAAFSRWLVTPSYFRKAHSQILSYKLTLLRTKGAKPNNNEWFIEVQDESKNSSSLSLALSSQLVNRAQEEKSFTARKRSPATLNHKDSRARAYQEIVA